jgi:xanthine dehydrogenase accessory factor
VYGIALSVAACLRAGTGVHVAWVVDADGLPRVDPTGALAITPGGGRVGSLLSGALDGQLVDRAAQTGSHGRLVSLTVGDVDALVAGLPSGGVARCMIVPASDLPADLWPLLLARQPVVIACRLRGDEVMETELVAPSALAALGDDAAGLARRASSATSVSGELVVTVLHPTPALVVVGSGPIAGALAEAAGLLGWHVQTATDPGTATGLIAGLASLDSVVVVGHDHELVGRALAAALAGDAGYIGAVGPRQVQQARADWLAYRGITDLERVHGIHQPAGLDIGARTPPEIAVAVLAEALAVRSRTGGPATSPVG